MHKKWILILQLSNSRLFLAEQFSKGSAGGNIDEYFGFGFRRVRPSIASGDLPYTGWFILFSFPIQENTCVQLASENSPSSFKFRIYWDNVWSSWKTFTGA